VTRRWSLRLLACLGAGALVLTGCSEKQEASDALPSESSAAPTEDELPPLGPEDMPMPDEARTQDAAGAEAFVRYYIDLINRTSTVMDAKPLRDLSDGCRDCDRLATNVEEDAAAGFHYEDGDLNIRSAGSATVDGHQARMAFVADQGPLNVIASDGSVDPAMSSGAFSGLTGGATVTWNEPLQSWLMTTLTLS
jgi:hypothetical protein